MATWQEENLSAILEYPFDFDRYIAEQLREIDDLDERIFAKKVLMEGLGASSGRQSRNTRRWKSGCIRKFPYRIMPMGLCQR